MDKFLLSNVNLWKPAASEPQEVQAKEVSPRLAWMIIKQARVTQLETPGDFKECRGRGKREAKRETKYGEKRRTLMNARFPNNING